MNKTPGGPAGIRAVVLEVQDVRLRPPRPMRRETQFPVELPSSFVVVLHLESQFATSTLPRSLLYECECASVRVGEWVSVQVCE